MDPTGSRTSLVSVTTGNPVIIKFSFSYALRDCRCLFSVECSPLGVPRLVWLVEDAHSPKNQVVSAVFRRAD